VNGRNEVKDFDEWVKLDLDYIRQWTPMLDLKILAKTASESLAVRANNFLSGIRNSVRSYETNSSRRTLECEYW